MKTLLLITLLAGSIAQANNKPANLIHKDSAVIKVMNQRNKIATAQGGYEIDFSETCEFEFDGKVNERGQCETTY